jgi:hypothetical protein
MKTSGKSLLGGTIGLMLIIVASSTQGAIVRPYGSVASMSEVQGVFDSIGSTIDAFNDQSTEAFFEPTGTGSSVGSFVASVSWGPTSFDVEFGIYDLLNPSQTVAMFNWANAPSPGATVVLEFDEGNNWVRSVDIDNIALYDQSDYYFKDFGFYVSSDFGGGTWYSNDDLNGGYARLLTYEGKGDTVTIGTEGTYNDTGHWYVAAEAGNYDDLGGDTSTGDFSDMIVQMESITPSDVVPEPGSVLLMTCATVGIVSVRRRLLS